MLKNCCFFNKSVICEPLWPSLTYRDMCHVFMCFCHSSDFRNARKVGWPWLTLHSEPRSQKVLCTSLLSFDGPCRVFLHPQLGRSRLTASICLGADFAEIDKSATARLELGVLMVLNSLIWEKTWKNVLQPLSRLAYNGYHSRILESPRVPSLQQAPKVESPAGCWLSEICQLHWWVLVPLEYPPWMWIECDMSYGVLKIQMFSSETARPRTGRTTRCPSNRHVVPNLMMDFSLFIP